MPLGGRDIRTSRIRNLQEVLAALLGELERCVGGCCAAIDQELGSAAASSSGRGGGGGSPARRLGQAQRQSALPQMQVGVGC